MAKRTFDTEVTINVRVTVDDEHLNEAFMAEFRESFYQFDTLERHVEHLAQIEARGLNPHYDEFIEGYGPIGEMGIALKVVNFSVTDRKELGI